MSKTEILESLASTYERRKDDENFLLSKVNGPGNERFIGMLIQVARFNGVYHTFISKNYELAKQYFYKAAKVCIYKKEHSNVNLKSSIYNACYALISGDSELIKEFDELLNSESDSDFNYHFSKILTSLYLDNIESLKESFEKLKAIQIPAGYEPVVEALRQLKNNELPMYASSLGRIEQTQGSRQEFELLHDLISIEGTAISVIAKRKGAEIQPSTTLIPLGLLTVNEGIDFQSYDLPE